MNQILLERLKWKAWDLFSLLRDHNESQEWNQAYTQLGKEIIQLLNGETPNAISEGTGNLEK